MNFSDLKEWLLPCLKEPTEEETVKSDVGSLPRPSVFS